MLAYCAERWDVVGFCPCFERKNPGSALVWNQERGQTLAAYDDVPESLRQCASRVFYFCTDYVTTPIVSPHFHLLVNSPPLHTFQNPYIDLHR